MKIAVCGLLVVWAQVLPPEVNMIIEEILGENSSEELAIMVEELARKKPNINLMDREALEATHLFSLFQIESILEHRQHFGDILSIGELSVIDGFNKRKAELAGHFFSFVSHSPPADTTIRTDSHNALAKIKKSYATQGLSLTTKYGGNLILGQERQLSLGVTLDSDAGERLSRVLHPDFTSAFLQYQSPKWQIIIGDYSARFGQGLVIWKAFSISSAGTPSSMVKKGRGILPYRSTDEANFLRGAAASTRTGKTDITAFVSYNALDARIVGDTAYTSITSGGYHRTESEIAKRRSMHEFVAGAGASREFGRWKVGFTAVTYCYDKQNGRTVKDYNRYQIYNGLWGNVGIDFYTHWRNWRFAGEAAMDFGGSCAAIATAVWSPRWELEMSLTGRIYSKSYIATHSGAWSTLSNCSNQRGVTFCSRWQPSDKWEADIHAEYSYYPWSRFNIDGASQAFKGKLKVIRNFGELSSADAEIRYSGGLLSGRINGNIAITRSIALEGRITGNEGGIGAFAGGRCSFLKGQMSLAARITRYDTRDYDHRVYFYEGDVPQSFSVKSYWGKGWAGYILFKYEPRLKNKRMKPELWLKVSQEASSLFVRIRIG